MAISESAARILADRILAAAASGTSIPPVTAEDPSFDLRDAYEVSAEIIRQRVARGEHPVGWKIGFTNRTIWEEYDVHAPIWGPMYDSTLAHIPANGSPVPVEISGLLEPRIEPEIVLRVARPPSPDMDARALLECIDAVGYGFELVQSVYPNWRFAASDTVAAFALHGLYRCGPLVPIEPGERAQWLEGLENFEIALFRDGAQVDRGVAVNVLDGPVHALRHFVRGLAQHPLPIRIEAGHRITTGTITRAFPVRPGEEWRTEITGLPLPGLSVRFT